MKQLKWIFMAAFLLTTSMSFAERCNDLTTIEDPSWKHKKRLKGGRIKHHRALAKRKMDGGSKFHPTMNKKSRKSMKERGKALRSQFPF